MPILRTNWKRSVTKTPHNPESVEMEAVTIMIPMAIPNAWIFVTPKTSIRTLTMARFTQPMMIRLMGSPR